MRWLHSAAASSELQSIRFLPGPERLNGPPHRPWTRTAMRPALFH